MNAIALLMGLLVLAYLGSFLVGERAIRGFGLPSGVEYVVLGFLLGPRILGLVDRQMVDAFHPFAHSANAWMAVIIGLEVGWVGSKSIPLPRLILGAFFSGTTGVLIAAGVGLLLVFTSDFSPDEILLTAGGIGAACSETTRHVIRWVVERHQAQGPLSELVADLADADDVVPLLALAVLFAIGPSSVLSAHSSEVRIAVNVLLGVALGMIAAMLLRGPFREHDAWGILVGTSLLSFGLADALGVSSLTVAFCMGLTINVLSGHAGEIRKMVIPTERSIMLPALLLAGAKIEWATTPTLWAVVLVALSVRFIGKMIAAVVLRRLARAPLAKPAVLGAGLVSSGALSIGIGLTFAYRFPGRVGDAVLVTAAILALAGEFIGPTALKSALTAAGEITAPTPKPVEEVPA